MSSPRTIGLRLRAPALAIQLAFGVVLGAVCLLPATGQAQTLPAYDIAPGPLAAALNRYAQLAGVAIVVDADRVQGLRTAGLSGRHDVDAGFAVLLRGTGLATAKSAAGYVLVAAPAAPAAPAANATNATNAAAAPAAQSTQTLGQITVSAQAARSATTEGSGSYTSNVVTLGRGEMALKDIPQSVSVLTRAQMDDQGVTDLRAAANYVTGVVAAKGVGQGMVINSRGFQIDSWQYDGVPIPRNTYALGNWGTEGLVYFDRLEVLRGAAGLLQGTGSPGGALNLVRKRGQADATVTLTGKVGSWDRRGAQFDAGGPINADGTLRGRVVADVDRSESFTDYVWYRNRALYGALDYDFSPDTTLGVGYSSTENRSRPMVRGLPRYPDGSDLGLPRSTYAGAWWNRARIRQDTVYADLSHKFGDRWKVKATAVYMDESNTSVHQRMHGLVAADGSGMTYANWYTNFDSTKAAADVYLNGRFDSLGMQHDVMFGTNYSKYTSADIWARTFTPGGNIFAIDHDRPWQDYATIMAAGGRDSLSHYDIRQKGVYGSWRARLTGPLTAILGARMSWYDYTYLTPRDGYTSAVSVSGKVSPYAGLVYALNRDWSAYASYTDVFETQSERTAENDPLKPIIGSNYELGLKGELMNGLVNASLAVFRYDHKNRASIDYGAGFNCDGWYCYRASGKVRSQGAEAEASGEVLPGLQLSAGYTYNTTRFLRDADLQGQVFSQWTPKHMLRVWSKYQLPGAWHRLSVGGGVSTQSHTVDYERAFKINGFTVFNALLAYQVTPQVSLSLNVNNLFDKRYDIPAYNGADGNNDFGDPRNLTVTLRFTPKF